MSLLIGSARVAIVPDVSDFGADLKAKLAAELKSVGRPEVPVSFTADDASLALLDAKIKGFGGLHVNVAPDFDASRLIPALKTAQAALDLSGGLKVPVRPDFQGGAAAAATAGVLAGGRGFGLGLLGGSIGGISAWHLALDLAAEALISVGTAAAAAAVGVGALYPVMNGIYDHFQSVYDVSKALGIQVNSLGAAFDKLGHQVAPQGYELLGGALRLVTGQTGTLSQAAERVVTVFDDWMARIDLWAKGEGTFAAILHTGTSYLQQFGQIAGEVGIALGNILRDDPGIARFLLDIVSGGARLLAVFTSLPGPIVEGTLALHGLYLWSRVLSAPLLAAGRAAKSFGLSLAGLAGNPLAWAAAAAVGLAYLAYQADQADAATKNLIGSINTQLASASASRAIVQSTEDLGKLNDQLRQVSLTAPSLGGFWSEEAKQAGAFGVFLGRALKDLGTAGGLTHITRGLGNLGTALHSLYSYTPASNLQQANAISAINAEVNKLLGSQRSLFAETGHLMNENFTYGQSLALMDLAGVKAADSFALMRQKVSNLITGYQDMSVRGNLLSNSVNAITFATDLQDSKVTQLTSAWSTFFSLVTGGESGLLSFGQALQTAGIATPGMTSGQITAGQNFLSAAQAAQTEMNNLTQLASASGLGAKGTALLTQANKDMLATLLPSAKGSAVLTASLYALAQQGGYQGADSFQALARWVGNVVNPMSSLNSIVSLMTVSAGNLTTDLQNLSTALGQTLNQAISQAIFYADGGQKAFNNFATALKNTGPGSQATQQAAQALATELISVTGNTTSAHAEFDTMTEAMGYTKTQADKLWASVSAVATAMASIHSVNATIDITAAGITGQLLANGVNPFSPSYTGAAPGKLAKLASGTDYAAPGLALVGERGPELVVFRGGEQVIPDIGTSAGFMALASALGPGHSYAGGTGSIGGGDMIVNNYFEGYTAQALGTHVRQAITAAGVMQGKRLRVGRSS